MKLRASTATPPKRTFGNQMGAPSICGGAPIWGGAQMKLRASTVTPLKRTLGHRQEYLFPWGALRCTISWPSGQAENADIPPHLFRGGFARCFPLNGRFSGPNAATQITLLSSGDTLTRIGATNWRPKESYSLPVDHLSVSFAPNHDGEMGIIVVDLLPIVVGVM